jgi:protocatechuate 3,4-dioxygenase beta subunit
LKNISLLGLGALLPTSKSLGEIVTGKKNPVKTADCWLTPEKTEGPFYFDPKLFRQDIRTDNSTQIFHNGLQLNMTFTLVNGDCSPVSNALIDIWHADKDGLYSGYSQFSGDTTGQDFMRGTQITDLNGKASFITSYPGWYPGRATHIHFKVRIDSHTYATSQLAFPDNINDEVYSTSFYLNRGANPVSNQDDNIFRSANPDYLVMEITKNNNISGYDGKFTIGINSPTGAIEKDLNPEGFHLEQNYPNPFNPSTRIKYSLASGSHIKLSVFDLFGREIGSLVDIPQPAGTYDIVFNGKELSSGLYFYRLNAGSYIKTREMLLIK